MRIPDAKTEFVCVTCAEAFWHGVVEIGAATARRDRGETRDYVPPAHRDEMREAVVQELVELAGALNRSDGRPWEYRKTRRSEDEVRDAYMRANRNVKATSELLGMAHWTFRKKYTALLRTIDASLPPREQRARRWRRKPMVVGEAGIEPAISRSQGERDPTSLFPHDEDGYVGSEHAAALEPSGTSQVEADAAARVGA